MGNIDVVALSIHSIVIIKTVTLIIIMAILISQMLLFFPFAV